MSELVQKKQIFLKKIANYFKHKRKIKKFANWNIYKRRHILKWMKILLYMSNNMSSDECRSKKRHQILTISLEEAKIIQYIFQNNFLTDEYVNKWSEKLITSLIEKNSKKIEKTKNTPILLVKNSSKKNTFHLNVFHESIVLSEKGLNYKNERKNFWIRNILSILALIISLIGIAVTIILELKKVK